MSAPVSTSEPVAAAAQPAVHASELFRDARSIQVLATAFFGLFTIVGFAVWGPPFFYDFMVREFGWTRAQVTSGNALGKIVVGPVFGFIAGYLVDRFGPRRLMMAGILLAGAALAGLGAVSTLGFFYLFYICNALGYVCGGPLPCQVLLSRNFNRARGKAMGIAYLGIGFGGAAVPWISSELAQRFGWHAALQMLGALVVLIALPMAFLLKESPGGAQTATTRTPAIGALKSAAFYLLAIGSMCSIAAVAGTQQNLKLFLTLDRQYSQSEAARVLSLVLGFSIVGRLLMGWLADRFPKKYVMLLIYALVALGIPLLFLAESRTVIYLYAVVAGIALGGDYMIIPLMTAEIFGVAVLGRLMGIILTADGVAEAVAPWLVGHMRDTSGSYASGFVVLIAAALAGAIAVAALPVRRRTA
jgi:sugar phosphate permease